VTSTLRKGSAIFPPPSSVCCMYCTVCCTIRHHTQQPAVEVIPKQWEVLLVPSKLMDCESSGSNLLHPSSACDQSYQTTSHGTAEQRRQAGP
jgi:hypothetical protein